MIYQIIIVCITFYIFISTIYNIKPGKNVKDDVTRRLDKLDKDSYIADVTIKGTEKL